GRRSSPRSKRPASSSYTMDMACGSSRQRRKGNRNEKSTWANLQGHSDGKRRAWGIRYRTRNGARIRRAFIIIHGDDVLPEDLNFPPEESEHIRFSPEIVNNAPRQTPARSRPRSRP